MNTSQAAELGKIKTRFAPSPTGFLHIGGLRTALYAYLYAKKHGGTFILRIEDTDQEREVQGAKEVIYNTLRECGIIYTEGPDVGGDFGPYIQSARREIYSKYAEKLVETGNAYRCFCRGSGEQEAENGECENNIGAAIDRRDNSQVTKYSKKCLSLTKKQINDNLKNNIQYCIRQNIPLDGISEYEDLVFGKISIPNADLEDNVLLKSDGLPTYNFANVVDDYLMGITHVIRGTEYLSSTPKYNLLYQAFGWRLPTYIHLQPIMKDHKQKLSKRYGAASYDDFIKKGFLRDAIINYIALLGWSSKSTMEKFNLTELEEIFSLDGISKSPSIFDEAKMRYINSLYMKELNEKDFYVLVEPFLKKLDYLKNYDLKYLATLLQGRCEVFSDVEKLTKFLKEEDFEKFDLNNFYHEKNKTDIEIAKKILPKLTDVVKNYFENLSEELGKFAETETLKKGQILWIFRIAITGAVTTCGGAGEMAKLLGKEKCLERLNAVIKRL